MRFYVYENWQAGPHKAVIHRGSCGHCKEGHGKVGGYDPEHAHWHGPFSTIEEARDASDALRDVVIHLEDRCVLSKVDGNRTAQSHPPNI
jgi:hypothetical protein